MIARNDFYITITKDGYLSTYLYGVTNDYITGTHKINTGE
jgi:hypothetical protein